MNRGFFLFVWLFALVALLPFRSPAPLYYSPGEGWHYEKFGDNRSWQRTRAKDQLDVAEQAYTNKDYHVALNAARRVILKWPLSDYAPQAELLIGQCLEAKHHDEGAFNAYQSLIQKYPNTDSYTNVLWRQYDIADRFLGGEFFRVWGVIPLYRSMDETARLFSTVVTNGPYSDVAPQAQMKIGAAREKQKNYEDAVKAYEVAADRYYNRPAVAADALYREASAYQKQAAEAEYDQGTAGKAISAYTDFMTLYPDDPRVVDSQKAVAALKAVQVAGNFKIAQFYEHSHKWAGAVVYYNEVLQLDPNSSFAEPARQRIEILKPRLQRAID